ncbi:VanZ family protein [Streptomyces sp. NPDC002564]|uniref:VanZ family protein n=1 Tax=Streptomyces sp. NPDC002564 TaxID=3364649 RepID=UPI0036A5F8DA
MAWTGRSKAIGGTGRATRTGRTTRSGRTGGAGGSTGAKGAFRSGTAGRRPRATAPPPADDAARRAAPLPPLARVTMMLLGFACMVGFAVVLARLTLEPSASSEALTHSNFTPGDSIGDYLAQPAFRDTVKQLGGNILLGVPFGMLLPVVLPRTRGFIRVGLATALTMVLVELAQGAFVTGRTFDIDDVILNTSGALLGYLLLGRRLGRAVHPRRRHWWHRFTRRDAATRA